MANETPNHQQQYQAQGYENRADYLRSLAEDYGRDLNEVRALADLLGPGEDFDGLVSALND